MLNTAHDPIDFLKREAANAGDEARFFYFADAENWNEPHVYYMKAQARRAWRFALAAQDLEDTAKLAACWHAGFSRTEGRFLK